MKKSTLIIFAALVLCFGATSGCSILAPKITAQVVAWPHTNPIIEALSDYYAIHKEYPKSLELLYPKFINKDIKTYVANPGIWSIEYKQIDLQTYELAFYHVHHTVYYKNGNIAGANSNPFR